MQLKTDPASGRGVGALIWSPVNICLCTLQASLVVPTGSGQLQHFCGAVIINRYWLLTTAHCVWTNTGLQRYVWIGEHSFSTWLGTEFYRSMGAIYYHRDYNNETLANDIALIRVTSPIQFSENVQPACPPEPEANFVGEEVVISGWGATSFGEI